MGQKYFYYLELTVPRDLLNVKVTVSSVQAVELIT